MRLAAKFALAAILIGILGFVGGYMVAGGPQKLSSQYLIGENIYVQVKAPGQDTFATVNLSSGMTVLDAVAAVMPIKTEVFSFGIAVKTIDDMWLVYTVNGESPPVGMAAYQLKGGERIELSLA